MAGPHNRCSLAHGEECTPQGASTSCGACAAPPRGEAPDCLLTFVIRGDREDVLLFGV